MDRRLSPREKKPYEYERDTPVRARHWGHAAIVGVLTLLMVMFEFPYRDLHGYFGMDDVIVIAIYVVLVAGVMVHGAVVRRRRESRGADE
jgi:hypothetical protein